MEKDLCASGIVILLFLVAMMALALLYSTLLSLSEWVSGAVNRTKSTFSSSSLLSV